MSSSYDKAALRKQRTDLWVGVFVFLGLAIMGALILQFGRFSDRLRDTYFLYVSYPDAGDIIRGAPVRLGGAKVGVVAEDPELNLKYTGVTVTLEIHSEKKIPAGSRFSIASSGLMGDRYIRIKSPEVPSGEYIAPDTTIKGYASGGLDEIQAEAGELSDQAKLMMTDIRQAVQSLDLLMEKVNNDLLGDKSMANLNDILEDLKKTGENFKSVSEKLGPLLDDGRETVGEAKEAATAAKTAFVKTGETLDTAKEMIKKAEPAVEKLEPTLTELKDTLAKANAAIDKITEGDGTAAALISDSGLKENLESFISNLNQHGILRYKNASEAGKDKAEDSASSSRSGGGLKNWLQRKR
jgi:ABC-type transporter Mla subunit MlaD